MPSLISEHLPWAAGLFEGEGTITTNRGRFWVACKNTDHEVLARFANVMPMGALYGPYEYADQADGHKRKPFWTWVAHEDAAKDALALFWPWLSERRRKRAREITGIRFHVFYAAGEDLRALNDL
jgi:hypothetical protein